ncbi:MAG TPA: glutamate ABC transporter substrate-binding protein [Acidimicrobiales bacterium]|nr:glutamate ABC transporter substrate-binding protein [Acidimicrobiales bacterium]
MRRRRTWTIVALAVLFVLLAAGCGDDKKDSTTATTTPGTATTVAPAFAPGSTMANIQARGKMIVGVKYDQPGFGQKNPTTNEVEGFDVETAKLIAVGIFGGTPESVTSKIEFKEAISKNRERFISEDGPDKVDMVVATYTINDARKQVVDFAGPYFVAKQDIMVKASDNAIKSVTDLNGKKVCTAKGSTSEPNVKAKAPQAEIVLFDTYSQCAEALADGRFDAETTDDSILAGLVQQSSGKFKLVGAPFSDEPYGIGMKKGDDAFRTFINDQLEKIEASGEWAKAFAATLGTLGLPTPTPPKINRYGSTPAAPTTTAAATTSTSTG